MAAHIAGEPAAFAGGRTSSFMSFTSQGGAMKISEIMTREVRIASPDHTISEAARIMAETDAGALPFR